MKQAEVLKSKRAVKEAEQLYSRVHDIVSSFSPENSPMIDVVNRKSFLSFGVKLGNWSFFISLTSLMTPSS